MKNRELLQKMTLLKTVNLSFSVAPCVSSILVLLTFISAAIPLFQVYAVAWFVDSSIKIVSQEAPTYWAIPTICIIISLIAYNWLSGTLNELLSRKLHLRLSETFRVKLVEKCAKLDYSYFENKDAQECITRVMQKAEDNITGAFQTLCQAFTLFTSVIGIIGIIMTKSAWIALMILIVSIPLMFLAQKSGDSTYKVNQENTKYERQFNYLGEVLQNREAALERTMFGYTEPLSKRWESVYRRSSKYIQRAYRSWYTKIELGSVLTALVSVSGVAFLLVPVVQGRMSIGIYISLVNACFNLINAMSWQLRGIVESVAHQNGYLRDVNQFLSFSEKNGAIASRQEPEAFQTISFRNVSFRYPNSQEYVLKDLSFEMEAGKHYAIVGSNGAGKSTIIKLLLGLYNSYEGEILIDGRDLNSLDPVAVKSLFSAVYQDFAAYQISLRESIQLGSLHPLSEKDLLAVIRDLQLETLVTTLPAGLDTPLGRILEGGHDVSGGQWQRIAIARCAVNPAPIRILDEPTAALDPLLESQIYENFAKISGHKTTIIISHRLGSTKLADEIIVLNHGMVVEKGDHQSLMEENGLYKEMFDSQRSWYL